jgi:hypothetical protein
LAALQSDRIAVDEALKQHPNALPHDEWDALKRQVDALAQQIPPCSKDSACAPAEATKSPSAVASAASNAGDSPRIVISSRERSEQGVRLRGYFEGAGLKSAGIYDGSERVKAFKVDDVLGSQRVEFDLRLENPSPAIVLRVTDRNGRIAEAPAIDADQPDSSPLGSATAAEAPGMTGSTEGSRLIPDSGGDEDTAEIPSHGPVLPSPSKRHTLGSRLADVQINILGVTQTRNLPPAYEVIGQIAGRGITHAGVYLDGGLVRPIPIINGASYTSFDQQVVVQSGSVTIRAYGIGSQFVEQSVDLFDAQDASELADTEDGALVSTSPIVTTPPIVATTPMLASGIAVQITGVRPVAGNLYAVSGIISGPNIASAGLYQNGVLAQNIGLGNGLAGALGALIPGSSRSINFNARFNPYAGPATIRAFDMSGAYTEQPIVVAGLSPGGIPWPGSPYTGTRNFPGVGSALNPYMSSPGATRPLW